MTEKQPRKRPARLDRGSACRHGHRRLDGCAYKGSAHLVVKETKLVEPVTRGGW